MSKPPLSGSPLLRALATTALCAFAALAPRPASAVVDCSNIRTPAVGVDRSLWGDLQPADTGQLPSTRDSTNYFGQTRPDSNYPLFTAVDIQNDYIFTSYLSGFQIWDARSNPADPSLLSTRDGWKTGDFPAWYLDGENRELVYGISLPAGRDDLMALAGFAPAGFSIWNTANKTSPVALYQDLGKGSTDVYSATIGGRAYAFLASGSSSSPIRGGPGIQLYDMTKAQQYTRCVDTVTATSCPGVWVARIGDSRTATSVDGLQTSSGRQVLGFSSGLLLKGLELWDVSNPATPQKLHQADRLLANDYVGDVALWEQNGHQYLAVRVPAEARIYDITSCIAGSCSSLDASLIWHQSLANVPAGNWFVTFSRSGSTPFLYFGVENFCYGGLHKEYLFNVTDPSHPVEIGATKTALFPDSNNTPVSVDYWGWYDVGSPTGFSNVMPRRAKFNGSYLYRMAWSIFDIHQWVAASPTPPTAGFSYTPAQFYAGDPVTFNDTSIGRVDTRSWTFQDGSPGSSTAAQPAVTFATPGSKSVSLTVSNTLFPNSPSTATNSVTVLDPSPVVAGAGVSPAAPLVCQPVTFSANGVTGRPTLNLNWVVKDGGGNTVASGSGSSFTWSTTGSTVPGSYTGTVTASNTSGNATRSVPVTLGSLPTLPGQLTFAPTNDAFSAGTVQFHTNASGATHWRWNFGDGSPVLDSTDPVSGPNPTHSYTATGTYNVTVSVSNCQSEVSQPSGVPSNPLSVAITKVAPLTIDVFQADGCAFGFCQFGVNQAVTFTETVSGGATSYDYDWNGDGNFEQSSSTPVTSHTYTVKGTYSPVLRANRGAESVLRAHPPIIVGDVVSNPPGISVSGPSGGSTGQALGFSATASNCTGTVSDSGWSWSATGGGTVSGSGSSVQVTWTTAGSKTVTATHSACGTARGSAPVTISDGNGNGGGNGLTAAFSFLPASPKAGDTVAFNGGASSGGPTSWSWNFGDGQTGSGTQVSHVYSQPGSYLVRLEVGKTGDGVGCSFGVCTAAITQTVTVAGGLQADFTSTAECIDEFGVNQCTTKTGVAVQLTANAPGATSLSWNFGDGGSATGAQVSHTWTQGGTFQVTLQASNGTTTVTVPRTFVVTSDNPPPPPPSKSVVLPWIAQTRGALVQSSDLYVHNPSANPMSITLSFRKRGLPDTNPPKVSKTIAPGATLYVPDVLGDLFNRENIAGFISLTVDQGDTAPVITSYNTTVQADGKQFGQTISGISMSSLNTTAKADATGTTQNLVGLINNSDRLAYFGVSNPSENAVNYRLRLYDKLGKLIGQTSQDLTVAPFGQRQFQSAEIESTFGVTNQDDYRVEVTATSSGSTSLVPYASNLRLSSLDPAFIEAGSSSNTKSYLLGTLSTPGPNGTLWQSDLLLSNINSQPVSADITFTGVGVVSTPTAPLHVTLQPGETQRLQNVIAGHWGINNAIGLLTIASTSPNGVFPIVQGESYDNSNPAKRFGQSMAAMTDASASGAGQGQYLVGLRQDATHRTTLWLFNPGTDNGVYDLVYRGLDGSLIATTKDVQLAGGKMRQLSPSQLPLPSSGAQNGFTLQIVVKSGKVLSAAQVVDNGTNDPSYIQGEVR